MLLLGRVDHFGIHNLAICAFNIVVEKLTCSLFKDCWVRCSDVFSFAAFPVQFHDHAITSASWECNQYSFKYGELEYREERGQLKAYPGGASGRQFYL